MINREVVVEIKCKESFHPVDEAQLLSYLRLLDLRVGLLINFHVVALKEGIKRMVNNYDDVKSENESGDSPYTGGSFSVLREFSSRTSR